MRNFWKKSVAAFIITVIFSLLMPIFAITAIISTFMPAVALAEGEAMPGVYCPMLDDPEKGKDWIITIIEEEIGSTSYITDSTNVTTFCYRETKCTGSPRSCTSTYKSSCTPSGADTLCQRVQVLMAKSGAGLLYMYIGIVYKWAAGVIGVVSVLYMVYGGIKIATAGDDAGKITSAREKIIQSISGLILLFLSAVILYTINPNFFTV